MPGNGAAAGASYGDLLVTSLLVLGAVCVAAFVAVRVFGRLLAAGRARGAHLLDVVARVPLEPRRSLYVVEVAGKTLLVGTSEMGLSVLSELDRGEVRSRVQPQQSFGELVRAAWLRRKGRGTSAASDAHVGTDAVAEPRVHVGTNERAEPRAHVVTNERAEPRAHAGTDERKEPRAHVGTNERKEPRAHVGTNDRAEPRADVGTNEVAETRLHGTTKTAAGERAPRDASDA